MIDTVCRMQYAGEKAVFSAMSGMGERQSGQQAQAK